MGPEVPEAMGPQGPDTLQFDPVERPRAPELIATVTVLEGPQAGALFVLDTRQRAHRLGRAEDADLRIVADSVSRYHAVLISSHRGGQLGFRVQDTSSTNGVKVNGRPSAEQWLNSGDKIRLGDVLLRFDWMSEQELAYYGDVYRKISHADRDPLTGLATRRFLSSEPFGRMLAGFEQGEPLSCAFVDLDRFKQINDRWGHLAGDAVIRRVGATMRAWLREEDRALRYGGEELLAILPGLDAAAACSTADTLRQAIARIDFSDIEPGIDVSVSVGVAQRVGSEAVDAWIERADSALYRAKEGGRDRVVLAS